jgi:transposase
VLLALAPAAIPSGGPLHDKKGVFRVVPRRWVVERTFAWLG